ncbi:MAG: hypothetical protein K2R98_22310 [Gemmataceae bacterium]|nr:hypothetical protein [Gemmataceae bacterium]
MQWRDIPFSPTKQTLRWFGVLLAGLLVVLAWRWSAEGPWYPIVLGLCAFDVLVAAVFRPSLLRLLYVGWMVAVFPIGWAVSHVLLGVLFYGIFTPLGLVFRLIGRDPLCRRRSEVDSYWTPKPMPTDVSSYFRQF